MEMSIAAYSVDMHQAQAMQALGLKAMEAAMDMSAAGMEELLDDITGSLDPNLGNLVDVSV
ncbi:MAG: YjfB family protein [Schwartzia sp.]|nr:YjfB family protein [Schwartzia sp. (in: firmicutes)]